MKWGVRVGRRQRGGGEVLGSKTNAEKRKEDGKHFFFFSALCRRGESGSFSYQFRLIGIKFVFVSLCFCLPHFSSLCISRVYGGRECGREVWA